MNINGHMNTMFRIIPILIVTFSLQIVDGTENRIVGGRPASEGEFPFQVSLRRSYNDNHFCGGSLIDPSHVLTAAHCMYYIWGGILPPFVVSVVAGQLNLTMTEKSVYRNASVITVHPGFDKKLMTNDVAIIELSEPFPTEENPLIATIPLREDHLDHGTCVVSGWGVEKHTSENVSEILLAANVDIVNKKKCNELYGGDTIKESMMCAGDKTGERDACQGDSGGPLLCNGLLTGVVSTGDGCANPNFPGIYADVSNLIPWIKDNSEYGGKTIVSDTEETTVIDSTVTTIITTLLPEANRIIATSKPRTINGTARNISFSIALLIMSSVYSLIRYFLG
ncbi:PREDICTED: trypsin-1-like [Nicrophorus vespilloides]|uniref:Trypsin-1-like n=1 Tax=Nicrophorus vespilloides TaxID=110193 RepID=A0ABM1NKG9_NICVS|nr:PREDICTED: trypsin-1-like [Nicrophorus vespilloides]